MLVWGSVLKEEQLNRLLKAQEMALDIVNSKKILSVHQLIKLELAKFMHKYSNNDLPKPVINTFEKTSHSLSDKKFKCIDFTNTSEFNLQ